MLVRQGEGRAAPTVRVDRGPGRYYFRRIVGGEFIPFEPIERDELMSRHVLTHRPSIPCQEA
ncbi:hypothetical protein GCM10009858_13490 [Terrabacter carboxydivorans]|uniref:Uncharacterized protein n=1 Tax=Terrabacter carboxydivorans TaxID=619730 RepID=A0ABP5Y9X5_9MICO